MSMYRSIYLPIHPSIHSCSYLFFVEAYIIQEILIDSDCAADAAGLALHRCWRPASLLKSRQTGVDEESYICMYKRKQN